MKVLLLGESPNFMENRRKVTGPGNVLESLAPRLCEFSGLVPGQAGAYAKLLEFFEVANAYDAKPWCQPFAREQTLQTLKRLRPRVVVCLGRRVGEILDIPHDRWNVWQKGFVHTGTGGKYEGIPTHEFLISKIPHPSGRCRLYNDLDIRERAHFTLRQALAIQDRLNQGERFGMSLVRPVAAQPRS